MDCLSDIIPDIGNKEEQDERETLSDCHEFFQVGELFND